MANDSRRLMTPRAAADRLGVSYSTFKQWIYKGSVRTVRTSGGHHRIAESEVERLLSLDRPRCRSGRPSRPRSGVLVSLSGRNQLRGHCRGGAGRRAAGAGPSSHRRAAPDRGHHPGRHRHAEAETRSAGPGGHQVHRGHDRPGIVTAVGRVRRLDSGDELRLLTRGPGSATLIVS